MFRYGKNALAECVEGVRHAEIRYSVAPRRAAPRLADGTGWTRADRVRMPAGNLVAVGVDPYDPIAAVGLELIAGVMFAWPPLIQRG